MKTKFENLRSNVREYGVPSVPAVSLSPLAYEHDWRGNQSVYLCVVLLLLGWVANRQGDTDDQRIGQ